MTEICSVLIPQGQAAQARSGVTPMSNGGKAILPNDLDGILAPDRSAVKRLTF